MFKLANLNFLDQFDVSWFSSNMAHSFLSTVPVKYLERVSLELYKVASLAKKGRNISKCKTEFMLEKHGLKSVYELDVIYKDIELIGVQTSRAHKFTYFKRLPFKFDDTDIFIDIKGKRETSAKLFVLDAFSKHLTSHGVSILEHENNELGLYLKKIISELLLANRIHVYEATKEFTIYSHIGLDQFVSISRFDSRFFRRVKNEFSLKSQYFSRFLQYKSLARSTSGRDSLDHLLSQKPWPRRHDVT